MLTKYNLVNVPRGGVDHLVNGRRLHISANLTDDQADELIKAGVDKYFRPNPKSNGKPSQASGNATGGPAAKPSAGNVADATSQPATPDAGGPAATDATSGPTEAV